MHDPYSTGIQQQTISKPLHLEKCMRLDLQVVLTRCTQSQADIWLEKLLHQVSSGITEMGWTLQ